MSDHDFQLTYSIPDTEDRGAAIARDRMRNIDEWKTVSGIETTLVGQLPLHGLLSEKRSQAERAVKKSIQELLKDSRKFESLTLHASLMVDGLGEHIRFNVTT